MKSHRPKPLFLTLAVMSVVAASFLLACFLQIRPLYASLIAINLTTVLMYAFDKHRAACNGSRIPEIVLHLLALAGGSPAAFLAQITFRHKTRKRPFRIIFIAIVFLQLIIIAGLLYLEIRSASPR